MEMKITGVMLYYHKVCTKKLWYFTHHIAMESHNEDVAYGKLLDETSYSRENKNILINDEISIDFIQSNGVIHEVKKSRNIEDASVFQLKYYIYYLEQRGITGVKGKIDYPLLKQTLDVTLSEKDVLELEKAIADIRSIAKSTAIPIGVKKNICKKCAYFDLCFI